MASIVVRSARIALAPGQVANLRVSVDRSLATAGGPGAGVVVNTPVTTQGFSIVLPAITLWTTWDAPDQTTKEAQYKAELTDANGVALYTLSSLDNFQIRLVTAQTTWKEITEYNEFLRESQSQTPPDAPQQYDSNPILLAPLNIFLGLGSNSATDSMGLYVGNSDNPPGLRHNVATGFWEFSHDGTTWATMGSGGGGGGTPGGPANSVQYNSGGSFGGDARVTIDPASGFLVLGTGVTNGGLRINGINGNYWLLSTTSPNANRTLYLPNTTLPTQGQALIVGTVGATVNLDWQTVIAGTCAANGVLVGTGVNTAATSGGLLWNAGVLTTQLTGNSYAGIIANNSTSGTASEVGFTGTSSNAAFQLNATSSLFPVSGLRKPNQVYLFASASAAELLLQTGDDAVPIVFGTNVTERMRLNATGLGIGGISPSTRLDVDSGTADDSGLRLRRMANATPETTATHYLGYDPATGKVVRATTPGGGGGGGTVTSVGLTMPGIFGVTGSPVTASGTLAVALNNQTANQIFAGPSSGGATTPAFRALVEADIPTLTVVGKVNTSALTGTLAAAQFPALAGDVTTSAGSLATTIAAQAVTFAKMQNVSTGMLLGRSTAGTGSLEAIGIGPGLSLSGGLLSATGGTIGGSIAVNQVAVGTGANTIGGSAAFEYSNGQLNVTTALDQTNYISARNTATTGGSARALLSADANVASVALYATGSSWAFPGFPGASASAVDAIGGPLYYITEATQPQIWALGATEAMRLNSTGLGLGNTPSTKLDITSAGANDSGLRLRNLTSASPAGAETAYLAVDSLGKVVRAASPVSSTPFADNTALVKNNADNTKLAIFNAANITTATTRTFTLPDANGTFALLGLAQTFTAAQTIQSNAAAAFAVGANGATNPVLQVDAATASVATGLKITGAAAGGGITLAAISSAANESIIISRKGSGKFLVDGFSEIGRGYVTVLFSLDTTNSTGANGSIQDGIGFSTRAGNQYLWASGTTADSTKDTGWARPSAAVIRGTNGSTGAAQLLLGLSTDTVSAQLDARSQSSTRAAGLFVGGSGAAATQRLLNLQNASLVDLGGFTVGGSLVLTNLGTAPSVSVTDACLHYVADVSAANANSFIRAENGAVTRLTNTLRTLDQDFNATTATLANVTGGSIYGNLSLDYEAGKTYNFRTYLFLSADSTGGIKVAINCSTAPTAIRYHILGWGVVSGLVINGQHNANGGSSTAAGVTTYFVEVQGRVVANTAGTLSVQFAQSTANGTSSVQAGSYLELLQSNA